MSGAYYNEIPTIVYLVTNQANGKQYVGITRQKLQRRWRGHNHQVKKGIRTALYGAIRKYGEEAFSIEQIASCLKREWSGEVETSLIVARRTKVPHGYNLTDGGDGVRGLPPEIIERVASMNRGRKHTDEAKRLIGLAGVGRVKSERGRLAISVARRGKPLSAEHRAKLAASKLGKKMPPRSAEHRSKIAKGLVLAHLRKREARNGCVL